ncbi:CYFA0S08e04940g1_1 [Cyberlindnera fabianii]|uniref:Glycine cleavage system H protein n=1 Tax=Cyberlindnera fabianii TaxID=36022 RepID=A0A061B3G8_CYBFA|nr:CYFA0S08e04940g1_1 [Cyberlindnera fabianii]
MFSLTRTALRTRAVAPLRLSFRFNSTINKINASSLVGTYSQGPITVRYTSEHEWIAQHPDGVSFVGITKYAADALGDATFVELPEVDDELSAGDSMGSVESVKSSSEIYAPVSGKVIEVNEALTDSPQLINEDPMGEAWLAKLQVEEKIESNDELLTEEQYHASLHEDGH